MNIKDRLKMEKELYFLRYIFTKPLDVIGGLIYEILSKPKNWLFIEAILFIALLYRDLVKSIFINYTIKFDILCWYGIAILFFTFMIDVYVRQTFQNDYKEWKKKQIENIEVESSDVKDS